MTEGNQQCITNQSQHKTKHIGTASVDGTIKRRKPRTTRKDEVEENLSIMGIKGRQAMARGRRE